MNAAPRYREVILWPADARAPRTTHGWLSALFARWDRTEWLLWTVALLALLLAALP